MKNVGRDTKCHINALQNSVFYSVYFELPRKNISKKKLFNIDLYLQFFNNKNTSYVLTFFLIIVSSKIVYNQTYRYTDLENIYYTDLCFYMSLVKLKVE